MTLSLSGNGITSANIVDGAVTEADLADATVTNLKSGRKNLIINGGFDVWQRGTSFNYSSSGANTYHADRWRFEGYNFTGSVTKTTLDNANALEFAVTNSSAGYVNVMQRVELTDSTLLGKTITLSAKIKGNGNFNIRVQAGAANTVTAITTATQTVTATSTISASDISDGFTNVRFQFDTNDTGTITIANVQLELGSVATDFEHRSYGEELALCQRYYEKSYTQGVSPGSSTGLGQTHSGSGPATSGYIGQSHTFFKQEKRVAPTITLYDSAGNSGKCARTTLGSTYYTNQSASASDVGASGFGVYSTSGTSNQMISHHYTADAEL